MSEEQTKPPVIDLDAILAPISEENPSGEYLRYSGIYDEITEARRADMDVAQGQWQTELKMSDFRKVIELAVPVLSSQSKDLQIASWLAEALTEEHGFTGLRDTLKMLSGLQDKFWDTMFPEIDEGDQEGRANAIAWMDAQAAFAIRKAPILNDPACSFIGFEDSKRFDIPDNIEMLETAEQQRLNELRVQAEKENRVTADIWRKAKTLTKRAFCEEINLAVEECWTEYKELNRVIEEKFDRNQMPGLGDINKALDDIHTQVKKLLEEKRAEEPDAVEEAAEGEAGEAGTVEGGVTVGGVAVATGSGAIRSRQDALKRLDDLAEYFRKTEPHSPVSYLVQRAVKWGNMPLENWLKDVIKDETVLFSLRQTLGFNTATDSDLPTESQ